MRVMSKDKAGIESSLPEAEMMIFQKQLHLLVQAVVITNCLVNYLLQYYVSTHWLPRSVLSLFQLFEYSK